MGFQPEVILSYSYDNKKWILVDIGAYRDKFIAV